MYGHYQNKMIRKYEILTEYQLMKFIRRACTSQYYSETKGVLRRELNIQTTNKNKGKREEVM